MSDLLPCPYCGSPDAKTINLGQDDPFYAVQCWRGDRVGCGATVGSQHGWDDARSRWNTRVTPSVGLGTEKHLAAQDNHNPASSSSATLSVTEGEKWEIYDHPVADGVAWGVKSCGDIIVNGLWKVEAEAICKAHNSSLSVTEAHPEAKEGEQEYMLLVQALFAIDRLLKHAGIADQHDEDIDWEDRHAESVARSVAKDIRSWLNPEGGTTVPGGNEKSPTPPVSPNPSSSS